jgi:methyltransferase (TIGR00027 family)
MMAEQKTVPEGLLATARWTASARAQESARPDRLFNDPWAEALAGEAGAAWLAQRQPGSTLPMVLRTRFFDDFLQRVVHENGLRQMVMVAAGLDTRAYRLNWPAEMRIYELDQAAVLEHKAQVLEAAGAQPTCQRQALAVDLTGAWSEVLLRAGFEPQQPTVWLLEGLLFYLPNAEITGLLEAVSRLAARGSWLGCDVVNGAVLSSPYTKPWVEMQAQAGAPWLGTLDDPEGYLRVLDWQATLSQAGAPDANHGRWVLPVLPTHAPGLPHNWYVTAQKN